MKEKTSFTLNDLLALPRDEIYTHPDKHLAGWQTKILAVKRYVEKEAEDRRAELLAKDSLARQERYIAITHATLACGCLLEKKQISERYARNIQIAQSRGWTPIMKKGAFVSCSNYKHETKTDKDGNVIGQDFRDYHLMERLLKDENR